MSVQLDRSSRVPNCCKCLESLMGQQYLVKDSSKFCVGCYESMYCSTCNKCRQIINTESRDISYKDFHFHEGCFSCNGCERNLTDQKFIYRDNKFICEKCYEDKILPKCFACKKTFKAGSKRMEYEGKSYHEKCFCCTSCDLPIGKKSFVKKSDGYYCQDCFESTMASKCSKCKKIIKSKGVSYRDETYHSKCFLCSECERNISGEQFITHDDKPYCVDCHKKSFSKKCFKCGEPISGITETKMIAFDDLSWHLECFRCVDCDILLEGEGFALHRDDTYCEECATRIS